MDFSEVGAELGSCCHSAWAISIGILQNRQEMQFSGKDLLAQGSYGAEVGRWGHPPNFARPSIEGEQKFGGWICSELGAELGSCCRSARAILIEILQNRHEMLLSAKDRMREGSYGEEVGRQGHPPNFVGPSIEGEQKFGGWICPKWA